MLLRLLSNLVTIVVYLVAIPCTWWVTMLVLIKWMVKDIAREWRKND